MAKIIIGILIFSYAAYVIVHRVKEFRRGKYCSCSCQDCAGNCVTKKKENRMNE